MGTRTYFDVMDDLRKLLAELRNYSAPPSVERVNALYDEVISMQDAYVQHHQDLRNLLDVFEGADLGTQGE